MTRPSNLAQRDIETVIHPYTNLAAFRETGPLVIESGKGVFVYDSEGREYIEGLSGLWCASLGYGNEELVEAAREQMARLSFSHLFGGKSHDLAIELSEKLKEIAPCEASKVLFCSGGSEANDMQVKLTWYYNNARGKPEKKKIISRLKAYHGVTVASGSLTGLPIVHQDFDLPIDNIVHASCPHYYRYAEEGETEAEFVARMARELDELIQREGPETVAAFIAEPVMGAGGVLIPPEGYFPAVGEVLEKYDVRLISDEVICGFGRTGEMFGAERLDFRPTSISVAKAITSACFPLGAITIEEDLYQAMLDESRKIGTFGHGYTYTGHPVGCAVALKTLEIYEREGIVERVRHKSRLFEDRFAELADHPLVGEARALGMIGAVELVADKVTKRPFEPVGRVGAKTVEFAQSHGLLCRMLGDSVALCPPLIMTEAEINEMFDRLARALDDAESWVEREDLRRR